VTSHIRLNSFLPKSLLNTMPPPISPAASMITNCRVSTAEWLVSIHPPFRSIANRWSPNVFPSIHTTFVVEALH
jgi:hypothetical protein